MKRVLVLHGHTENSHVFGRKFDDIREALKDDIEFGQSSSSSSPDSIILSLTDLFCLEIVFTNAPHLLTPIDPPGAPVFSSAEVFAETKNLDPKAPTKHTPRGWFYHTHDAKDGWAVSQSLMHIRGVLETEGPFQVSCLCLRVVR